MFSRLLYLEPGQLRRLAPFFGLYLLLFSALTLADGLSLTLLIKQAGPQHLPRIQGLAAVATLAATFLYLCRAPHAPAAAVFRWILAGPMLLFALLWVAIGGLEADSAWLGGLLIGRELAFALVLLHFGSYLQDFFTRSELNRVMPIVYAGGRLGGIGGGMLLEHLPAFCEPIHMLPLVTILLGLAMAALWWIGRCVEPVDDAPPPAVNERAARVEPSHGLPAPHELAAPIPSQLLTQCAADNTPATMRSSAARSGPLPSGAATDVSADEAEAIATLRGFLRFAWTNPLMFWISATTIVYFACRTFLGYRCGLYFNDVFTTDAEMTRFLGRYTQWALAGSLILQLFVVNRWIALAGLHGAQLTYAALLLAASLLSAGSMTLASAVFIRLVEGELRYSLRNPVSQLIVNRFSRPLRLRARAWSLGLLIPLSTLAASGLLSLVTNEQCWSLLLGGTVVLGCGYLLGSFALVRSLNDSSDGRSLSWPIQVHCPKERTVSSRGTSWRSPWTPGGPQALAAPAETRQPQSLNMQGAIRVSALQGQARHAASHQPPG